MIKDTHFHLRLTLLITNSANISTLSITSQSDRPQPQSDHFLRISRTSNSARAWRIRRPEVYNSSQQVDCRCLYPQGVASVLEVRMPKVLPACIESGKFRDVYFFVETPGRSEFLNLRTPPSVFLLILSFLFRFLENISLKSPGFI